MQINIFKWLRTTQNRAEKRDRIDGTVGICSTKFKHKYVCRLQLLVDDLKIATLQQLQPLVIILRLILFRQANDTFCKVK